jgi:predicted aminopeptidase
MEAVPPVYSQTLPVSNLCKDVVTYRKYDRFVALLGASMAKILTSRVFLTSVGGLVARFLAATIILHLISGCYVASLAYHQNNLMNSRRIITSVLADGTTDQNTKGRLEFATQVIKFASENGLNARGAYEYYVRTADPVVSYLLQVAYPDRLEAVTWWFPIVGRVPYRGYFDETERDAAAATYAAQGFDVARSGVGAFSSLGWFDDPIYSAMLRRKNYSLANLLFHELTHRTLWAPGSTQFNENLAEFVANHLTQQYLTMTHDRDGLAEFKLQQADGEIYQQWLGHLRAELDRFFKSAPAKDTDEFKNAKAKIFASFVTVRKPKFARFDYVGKEPWNNARVVGAALYNTDLSEFQRAQACNSKISIGDFLAKLREILNEESDPSLALRKMCETSPLNQ